MAVKILVECPRTKREVYVTERPFYPIGSKVVAHPHNWIITEFDSWGRGKGIGTVVEPPFKLEDDCVDVQWPDGRCFERIDQILPAPFEEQPWHNSNDFTAKQAELQRRRDDQVQFQTTQKPGKADRLRLWWRRFSSLFTFPS